MKILLDECVDWRLKFEFKGYAAYSVKEMGWAGKKNGDLMKAASDNGFTVFVTIDKKIRYQQNLSRYNHAIIILDHHRSTLRYLKPLVAKAVAIMKQVKAGEVYEISESD